MISLGFGNRSSRTFVNKNAKPSLTTVCETLGNSAARIATGVSDGEALIACCRRCCALLPGAHSHWNVGKDISMSLPMAGTSTTRAAEFDLEHKREKLYLIKVADEHAQA